jgi:hypothetical protein
MPSDGMDAEHILFAHLITLLDCVTVYFFSVMSK